MSTCVFCDIIDGFPTATVAHRGVASIMFEPLDPVTPGHLLVAPYRHVADAFEDPDVTGATMRDAATWAANYYPNANLITSIGASATQSVRHLHIHIVPRREGDGLHLPWAGQQGDELGGKA